MRFNRTDCAWQGCSGLPLLYQICRHPLAWTIHIRLAYESRGLLGPFHPASGLFFADAFASSFEERALRFISPCLSGFSDCHFAFQQGAI